MQQLVHKRGISELSGSHYTIQAHTYLYSTGPPVSICLCSFFEQDDHYDNDDYNKQDSGDKDVI